MSDPRVAIVGSRDFPQPQRVTAFVEKLAVKYPCTVVISGGARGVDTLAVTAAKRLERAWAEFRVVQDQPDTLAANAHRRADAQCRFSHHLAHDTFALELLGEETLNDWASWCDGDYMTFAQAAFARNTWIVKAATHVVAFHDGQSRGTLNSMQEARRLGRDLTVFTP